MKTKFPRLPYDKRMKMILSENKKNPDNKKNILSSIRGIKKEMESIRRNENDLLWDLEIYRDLLMLTLLAEARKNGFKENAKVIFIKDNSEHSINNIYFDKELLEMCVNLYPPPNVSYFNKSESPVRLSHIKLAEKKI